MFVAGALLYQSNQKQIKICMFEIMSDAHIWFQMASWATLPVVVRHKQFHQPRLVIRIFHRQGAAVEEGIFAMNIVKKSTHAVINKILTTDILICFCVDKLYECILILMGMGSVYDFFATIKEIWSQNFSI